MGISSPIGLQIGLLSYLIGVVGKPNYKNISPKMHPVEKRNDIGFFLRLLETLYMIQNTRTAVRKSNKK